MKNIGEVGILQALRGGEVKRVDLHLYESKTGAVSGKRGVEKGSSLKRNGSGGVSDVLIRKLYDKLEFFYDAFRVRATYRYDEKAGVVVITVKDVKTGEVVRRIPPWEVGERSLIDLKGLLFEKRV